MKNGILIELTNVHGEKLVLPFNAEVLAIRPRLREDGGGTSIDSNSFVVLASICKSKVEYVSWLICNGDISAGVYRNNLMDAMNDFLRKN